MPKAESADDVELHAVGVEKPEELNLILGQSHFIKTVEDPHEALAGAGPGVRSASRSASPRGQGWRAGRATIPNWSSCHPQGGSHRCRALIHRSPAGGFPVSVLNQLTLVPDVRRIYCATANPVQVIVGQTAARARDPRRHRRRITAPRQDRRGCRSAPRVVARNRLRAVSAR